MTSISESSNDSFIGESAVIHPSAEIVDDQPLCFNAITEGKNVQFLVHLKDPVNSRTERATIEGHIRYLITRLLSLNTPEETMFYVSQLLMVERVSVVLASAHHKQRREKGDSTH